MHAKNKQKSFKELVKEDRVALLGERKKPLERIERSIAEGLLL